MSLKRSDMFNIMEGSEGPADADLEATATNRKKNEQAQEDYDKANKDLYAILFLLTEKPAALLVNKLADGSRGTRGSGRDALKELESK